MCTGRGDGLSNLYIDIKGEHIFRLYPPGSGHPHGTIVRVLRQSNDKGFSGRKYQSSTRFTDEVKDGCAGVRSVFVSPLSYSCVR